jgi:hypothetical protein
MLTFTPIAERDGTALIKINEGLSGPVRFSTIRPAKYAAQRTQAPCGDVRSGMLLSLKLLRCRLKMLFLRWRMFRFHRRMLKLHAEMTALHLPQYSHPPASASPANVAAKTTTATNAVTVSGNAARPLRSRPPLARAHGATPRAKAAPASKFATVAD